MAVRSDSGRVVYVKSRGVGADAENFEIMVSDGTSSQLVDRYVWVSELVAYGDEVLVLGVRDEGASDSLARVDPVAAELQVIAELPEGVAHATVSSDGRYTAIVRNVDPTRIGEAKVEVRDESTGEWSTVQSAFEDFTTSVQIFFDADQLYIGRRRSDECLVESARIADADPVTDCRFATSSAVAVWNERTLDANKLLAVCDGEMIAAWAAPQKRADHVLVALNASGDVEVFAEVGAQQSAASYSCGGGGAAIHSPGSLSTIITFDRAG